MQGLGSSAGDTRRSFAGGAQKNEESSAAAEPAMKSAGDSVIGFDMYSLDSGRISITRSVKRK